MGATDSLDLRRRDAMAAYRPQREWIEGRGVLIVVAHFLSGVGAGTWLFSQWLGFRAGLWLALLLVGVCSGFAHLGFLGRWERCWRMLRRPHQSWISRGIWSIALFLTAGTASLVVASAGAGSALAVLGTLGAALTLVYEGFVYFASKGIPFWRSPILPLLYVGYGLRGGAALLLIAAALGGVAELDVVEAIKIWTLVSTAVLVLVYLIAAGRAGGASRRSVRELVAGRISLPFYGGTLAVGILVPLALSALHAVGPDAVWILGLVGLTSLIGDFYVKYCIVKAGIYVPLAVEGMGRA